MRLTAASLKKWREQTLVDQLGRCALCLQPVKPGEAVGDHCHTTGQMRGVLHRGCNSGLGKIENFRRLYGLTDLVKFQRFLQNVVPYIYAKRPDDTPLYHTHRSADEKKVIRNARARKARVARKAV